jgi:pimeloyl-ACP methyl ester carboxylesterase
VPDVPIDHAPGPAPAGDSDEDDRPAYRPIVEPSVAWLDVNGLRHRVLEWGPVQEPPVVLLHGFQDCADTFQPLVDALPRDWHCVAFDWRGFGHSEGTGRPYWFPDYYADLERILDTLSPAAPARLIGHSMGGNVALIYAALRPQRVAAVASLEGFGLPRATAERAPDRIVRWLDELRAGAAPRTYDSVGQLAAVLARRNPRWSDATVQFMARAWTAPLDAHGVGGRVRLRHDPWHQLVNPTPARREDAEACWRRIVAPVLMVLAELSEFRARLGDDLSEATLGRCLPGARVETLAGVGHMLHLEAPAAVAQSLRIWNFGADLPAAIPSLY